MRTAEKLVGARVRPEGGQYNSQVSVAVSYSMLRAVGSNPEITHASSWFANWTR
jgi:hypothetical protein